MIKRLCQDGSVTRVEQVRRMEQRRGIRALHTRKRKEPCCPFDLAPREKNLDTRRADIGKHRACRPESGKAGNERVLTHPGEDTKLVKGGSQLNKRNVGTKVVEELACLRSHHTEQVGRWPPAQEIRGKAQAELLVRERETKRAGDKLGKRVVIGAGNNCLLGDITALRKKGLNKRGDAP